VAGGPGPDTRHRANRTLQPSLGARMCCNNLANLLPARVCLCCPLDLGVQVLVGLISALRLVGVVCSGFYGPWLYLVLTLASLFLAADFLLIYSLFWKTDDGKPSCDFTNQKVWIIIWQSLNILGEVGLCAALGWYVRLGLWAMLHEPIHFAVFLLLLAIIPLILYAAFLVLGLYFYLKEAYIDELLGQGAEDEGDAGLTQGGRRISV